MPSPAVMIPAEDARLLRYLGLGSLLLLTLWFSYQIREVLTLFALAAVLAYAFDPVLSRLETRGMSRTRAVILGVLVAVLIFMLALLLFIPILSDQVESLARNHTTYRNRMLDKVDDLERYWARRIPNLERMIGQARTRIMEISPKLAAAAALWVTDQLPKLFTYLIILPMLTFYMLLDYKTLSGRLLLTIPADYRDSLLKIIGEINAMLGRYIRGQMMICGLYAVSATLYFVGISFLFGTKYSLLLGLITGVLAVVPFLGILTTAVLALALGYLTCDPSSNPLIPALLMPGGLMGINLVIDNVVTPRVIGKETGLHPVTVIFALMSGSQLAGLFAMIVAIPTAAGIKIALLTLFPGLRVKAKEKKGS